MASAVSETNFMPHRHRSMVQAFATRSIRTICVMSVLLLHQHTCSSQESPMIGATPFDYSTSYRTNVCERQHLLYNDTIQLRDALQGLNLSVYITDFSNKPDDIMFQLSQEGTIPENNPGIMAVILDELAKRAGFTWRNRFGSGTGINTAEDGNKTFGDLLIWSTDTYDISADIWGRSNERKARGVNFVEFFYDNSIILVTKENKSSSNSNRSGLWSFLRPFSNWVWISIGISIFVTSFLYTFLERLESHADERDLENKPLATAFLTAMSFTGNFEFQVRLSTQIYCLVVMKILSRSVANDMLGTFKSQIPTQRDCLLFLGAFGLSSLHLHIRPIWQVSWYLGTHPPILPLVLRILSGKGISSGMGKSSGKGNLYASGVILCTTTS